MKKIGITALLATVAISSVMAETEVNFTYTGEEGPKYWHTLSTEWETCKNGLDFTQVISGQPHQSPVDFVKNPTATASSSFDAIDYDYEGSFLVTNNGHSIKIIPQDDQVYTITINNKEYKFLQFHLHGASEHTEKGKHPEMEMHLVHQADDGSYAVLGMFIDGQRISSIDKKGKGRKSYDITSNEINEEFSKIFTEQILPKEKDQGEYTVNLNLSKIINPLMDSKIYEYEGSLTTPPCTEGVTWKVFKKHIIIPREDIQNFQEIYNFNYRPVTGEL